MLVAVARVLELGTPLEEFEDELVWLPTHDGGGGRAGGQEMAVMVVRKIDAAENITAFDPAQAD